MLTIKHLMKEAHKTAREKGWWNFVRNKGELIALMHSELSEALEALRVKDKKSETGEDAVGTELADTVIRIADFCQAFDINLEKCIKAKMAYNKTREHRHGNKVF